MPFWQSEVMEDESVLFVKGFNDVFGWAPLLFPATSICAVKSSRGDITYHEGRDWIVRDGGIALTRGSSIPCSTINELTPPKGSQPYGLTRRDGTGDILFGENHEYHDRQVIVTYRHQPGLWRGPVPSIVGVNLPRVMEKLHAHGPFTMTIFGDSISTGCNSSGWAKVPSFQLSYPELFAQRLEKSHNVKLTVRNFAVGGMASGWGVDNIGPIAESRPDLAVLAWGMNDANAPGLPDSEFAANIRTQINAVKAASP